jgi:hypothetical protein
MVKGRMRSGNWYVYMLALSLSFADRKVSVVGA